MEANQTRPRRTSSADETQSSGMSYKREIRIVALLPLWVCQGTCVCAPLPGRFSESLVSSPRTQLSWLTVRTARLLFVLLDRRRWIRYQLRNCYSGRSHLGGSSFWTIKYVVAVLLCRDLPSLIQCASNPLMRVTSFTACRIDKNSPFCVFPLWISSAFSLRLIRSMYGVRYWGTEDTFVCLGAVVPQETYNEQQIVETDERMSDELQLTLAGDFKYTFQSFFGWLGATDAPLLRSKLQRAGFWPPSTSRLTISC